MPTMTEELTDGSDTSLSQKAAELAASDDVRLTELGAMLDIAVACSSRPAEERAGAMTRAYRYLSTRYRIGREWQLSDEYGETYRIVTDVVPIGSRYLSAFVLASATQFEPRVLGLLSQLNEDQLTTIYPVRDALLTIRALHHFSREQSDEAIEDLQLHASREPVFPVNLASLVLDISGHDPRTYPAMVQLSRYSLSPGVLGKVLVLLRRGRVAERYYSEHAPEPQRSLFRRLLHVQQRVTAELCSGHNLLVHESGLFAKLKALLSRIGREQRKDVTDTRRLFIDLVQSSMEADPDPFITAFATVERARILAALDALHGAIVALEGLVKRHEDEGCLCTALEYLAFLYAARGEQWRARDALGAVFRCSVLSDAREAHRAEEDAYIGYGGRLEQLTYLDRSDEIPTLIEQNRMNISRAIQEHAARANDTSNKEQRNA